MVIEGTVVRVDEPQGKHQKFKQYLLLDTIDGKLGLQVRSKRNSVSENSKLKAKVHFEHSTQVANSGNGKKYYHNNLILDEVLNE